MADQAQEQKGARKERVGEVIADKMDKTIVVRVERRVVHPRYGKVITLAKKFYVHDENNEGGVGDKVAIEETRPLSKLKRWRLVKILHKAEKIEKIADVPGATATA
ncbi:MAG: 30S ribosomal protein S17 [Verrucomicrobiae bacterium]|nr:30S ribosomal protein S17 [Verrucomicrobiae bacterium]